MMRYAAPLLACLLLGWTPAAHAASLVGLGDFPGGTFSSEAQAVSADGRTVVGYGASASASYQAFRWTKETGMTALGNLPGGEFDNSYALAVSADGKVVAGYGIYGDNQTIQACRWTNNGLAVGLGYFPTGRRTYALGISADGNVIVGWGEGGGDEAFRWTATGGIQGLGDLPGGDFRSRATAASADGSAIVGNGQTATSDEAILWVNGRMEALGHLPDGVSATAAAVSEDGRIVVGFDGRVDGTGNAFRWMRTTGLISLGPFRPRGVSADGEVVVGRLDDEAVFWVQGLGMRRLWDALNHSGVYPGLDGWTTLVQASAVSDDGHFIAGFGERSGRREAFLAEVNFSLQVRTNGNGTVSREPDQPDYPANSIVSLRAMPRPDAFFLGWSGDAGGTNNPLVVTMTKNKAITARFGSTVVTNNIQGVGTLSQLPDRPYYNFGESVVLTALPGRWHAFSRWGDGVTNNPRTITIGENNTYTAIFAPTTTVETLTFDGVSRVAPVGMPVLMVNGKFIASNSLTRTGAVEVAMLTTFPNGTIFYTVDESAPSFFSRPYQTPFPLARSVTMRAVAFDAFFAQSWEADPLQLTIIPEYALNVETHGGGGVTMTPAGATFASNSVVSLTATPAEGWAFLHWLGDVEEANPDAWVIMNRARCVEAVFGTTLSNAVAGAGTVLIEPATRFYPHGTTVRLTAVPQEGYQFAAWGGMISSTTNPVTFVVTNPAPIVSAAFGPLAAGQSALCVVSSGYGRVNANPRANRYASGTTVMLTATPEPEQDFLGWSGDAGGTRNPLTLTMDTSKIITANFTKRPKLELLACDRQLESGETSVQLSGALGEVYLIETSADLQEWSVLATLTNVFGTTQLNSARSGQWQFYRARTRP